MIMDRNNALTNNPVGYGRKEASIWADVSSTAQDKSKQQLTYTTVGSIYNPNATAQIQPPTRRPRTRRYPHPLDSPGFGLESELLSSLPLKESAPVTPPTTASVFQQYTPLQQNYDRAVNPAETNPTDLERSVLSSLGMPLPTIRSGNLPPPSGLDDDDSVASEDTLATSRINVKGLTNLASYPNPMQKAAQKALARARPANLSLSRPKTPPSLTYTGFSRERMPPTHTAAASVTTGAPQPLTAGPPGRRERRPGAFEDAIRAARFEKLSEEAPGPSSMRAGYMPRSSAVGYGTTYDSVKNSSQSFPSLNNEFPVAHGPISQGIARPPAAKQSNSPTTPIAQLIGSDGHYRRVYDAAPVGQDVQTYTNSSNYVELGRRRGEDDDWYTQSVIAAARQEDPFSRSIDPVEHRRQLNCAFYAGTKGLVKDISQVEHEYHYRRLVDKIGVIGGERHRLGDSHIDSLGEDGKVQLRPLSIKEASQMPESEHVKPLLSLAYAAMLNYREDGRSGRSDRDGWGPKFREVDDAWVDNSEEGNKSLFDKPKEPPKKKKLVVKKTKLGY